MKTRMAFALILLIGNLARPSTGFYLSMLTQQRTRLLDGRMSEVPVTPCTRICRYNNNVFDGQVCIGCFRDTFEIGAWSSLTAEEKHFALLDAADRMAEAFGIIDEASTGTSSQELLRQAEYWRSLAEER